MDKQLLSNTLVRLSPRLLKRLKDYTRFPTERNECYMIGYIIALEESWQMKYEDCSYLLALCGRLRADEEVRSTLKEALCERLRADEEVRNTLKEY